MTKLLQAVCLLAALVALGVMWSPAGAVLVGGVLVAVLLELDDMRKGGD